MKWKRCCCPRFWCWCWCCVLCISESAWLVGRHPPQNGLNPPKRPCLHRIFPGIFLGGGPAARTGDPRARHREVMLHYWWLMTSASLWPPHLYLALSPTKMKWGRGGGDFSVGTLDALDLLQRPDAQEARFFFSCLAPGDESFTRASCFDSVGGGEPVEPIASRTSCLVLLALRKLATQTPGS